jgi:hypothetical protein
VPFLGNLRIINEFSLTKAHPTVVTGLLVKQLHVRADIADYYSSLCVLVKASLRPVF